MKTIKHTSTFFIITSGIALFLFLLDSTGILIPRFGRATALLLLPLLTAIAMAAREWIGLLFGMGFGLLLDTAGAEALCFNTIMLFIIGCLCGLLCSYFVNDNIFAAIVLSFFSNLFYFGVRWLIFFAFAGRPQVFDYLWRYCIPDIFYNTIFIIPFYYLIKYISKKTSYYD